MSRTRFVLTLAGIVITASLSSGCIAHRNPYRPSHKPDEWVRPSDIDLVPDRVEKIQVGRDGPVGYIRVERRWVSDSMKQTYSTTWVYDEKFTPQGFFTDSGETVRFIRAGHETSLGILDHTTALYALLSGRDRFPETVTNRPELLQLPMDAPRTGSEKPE